jgi:hypothetical protein
MMLGEDVIQQAGYAILDTTKIFKIQGMKSIILDYFIEIPHKNLIEVVPYKEMQKTKETYTNLNL